MYRWTKLYALLPTVILFALPWWHKIVYNSWILAWPGLNSNDGHVLIAFITIGAGLATAAILGFIP